MCHVGNTALRKMTPMCFPSVPPPPSSSPASSYRQLSRGRRSPSSATERPISRGHRFSQRPEFVSVCAGWLKASRAVGLRQRRTLTLLLLPRLLCLACALSLSLFPPFALSLPFPRSLPLLYCFIQSLSLSVSVSTLFSLSSLRLLLCLVSFLWL